MSIECKHGYLARACDRCEMEEEIERLRAVVAAWDALGEAKTSQCTCASFVIQYEGCCCGRSRRTRAAETELLAAREAVGLCS